MNLKLKLKASIALAIFLLGCYYCVGFIINGGYISAAAILLAGGLTATTVLFGWGIREWWPWYICAAISGGLSIFAVVFETRGFDIERQQIQSELVPIVVLATANGNPWELSPTSRKVAEAMIFACAIQGSVDTLGSISAAQKAMYFGPGATMTDATIDALDGKTREDRCIDGLKKLYREKPLMFRDIVIEHAK
ncbi:hypothetical protein [Collimonas fungivorans]|uniref:hypothetical protein n=1 Tax=Collimonas fungivorans TaxID=158899 RepID=UPI0011D234EC|nr:hypothetical protein [Collimonas fungivorans]